MGFNEVSEFFPVRAGCRVRVALHVDGFPDIYHDFRADDSVGLAVALSCAVRQCDSFTVTFLDDAEMA